MKGDRNKNIPALDKCKTEYKTQYDYPDKSEPCKAGDKDPVMYPFWKVNGKEHKRIDKYTLIFFIFMIHYIQQPPTEYKFFRCSYKQKHNKLFCTECFGNIQRCFADDKTADDITSKNAENRKISAPLHL